MKHLIHLVSTGFLALCLLVPSVASAQKMRVVVDEFEVGRWVTDNMQSLNIPSIAVGVVGPERDYYLEAYGPAELDEPFLVGSISKSVTALATMLLVNDGKVKLDDPASKWVAGVPDAVTVESLLYQRSGIVRADGAEGWSRPDASVEELVASAEFSTPDGFTYSNLNYAILGQVIEKASEQRYADFVKERIFEPAKMTTASAEPSRPTDHVRGHQYMFGFPMESDEPAYSAALVPAQFIWMSAQDMSRWMRLFVTKGKLDSKQVFPAETIEKLLTPANGSNYAMGWMIREIEGTPVPLAEHSGATASFSTAMSLAPEREFGAFVFTNTNLWLGLGTATILQGVMSPVLGMAPSSSTNLEFIVRLGFGILVALIVLTFIFESVRWWRSGFPMKLNNKEIVSFGGTVVLYAVVLVGLVMFWQTPIDVIVTTQPDLGYGFLVTVVIGLLRQLVTGFNKTAHLTALRGGEE